MGQYIWGRSSLKGRTWSCVLPNQVLQDVLCKTSLPLSAVWCFMKTILSPRLFRLWRVWWFSLLLEMLHCSVGK